MRARWIVAATALVTVALTGCEQVRTRSSATDVFADGTEVGELRGGDMREASGIVASARFAGHFWLHNDSGNDPELFLIDSTGAAVLRVEVRGVENRDWEDIARRSDTLFIAEMGDNQARWDTVYVHTVLEPSTHSDSVVSVLATFPMRYPDGPRDAETLLVDPRTGDWYIVSKREERSRLYRYPAPQRPGEVVTLERVPLEFEFRLAVGGDVSADGREVLVKTYDAVYLWERNGNESLADVLRRRPRQQPYTPERQGEAVSFGLDRSAYFTTSEVELDAPQLLLRYARVLTP